MTRTLATALLALSLTASGAFATSFGELVLVDGLYHKKFTDVPFTGKVDEGRSRGALKNGNREGPWVVYHENGGVRGKGAFKNGKAEGHWRLYWDNGQVRMKSTAKNGKIEEGQPYITYHKNGQVQKRGSIKDGLYRGSVFRDNGQLHGEGALSLETETMEGPWVVYDEHGNKDQNLSGTYRNGEKVSD
jgi:antitoxin component YwqK of YwqJK toxin-antitoxin module